MSYFLGLDPGYARLGYGVIAASGTALQYVTHGVIETSPEQKDGERLVTLDASLTELLSLYPIEGATIEQIFLKKNLTTGIKVSQARGVVLLGLARKKINCSEVSPTALKKMLTGSGTAGKKQMQEMIRRMLKLDSIPSPDDAADALALAIAAFLAGKRR